MLMLLASNEKQKVVMIGCKQLETIYMVNGLYVAYFVAWIFGYWYLFTVCLRLLAYVVGNNIMIGSLYYIGIESFSYK